MSTSNNSRSSRGPGTCLSTSLPKCSCTSSAYIIDGISGVPGQVIRSSPHGQMSQVTSFPEYSTTGPRTIDNETRGSYRVTCGHACRANASEYSPQSTLTRVEGMRSDDRVRTPNSTMNTRAADSWSHLRRRRTNPRLRRKACSHSASTFSSSGFKLVRPSCPVRVGSPATWAVSRVVVNYYIDVAII